VQSSVLVLTHLGTFGLLRLPLQKVISYFFVITFIAIGSLLYITGKDIVIWIPYLMGCILYLRLLGNINNNKSPKHFPVFCMFTIAIYFAYVIVNTAFNFISVPQLLVGMKAYFMLWPILFLVAFSTLTIRDIEKIWHLFLFIIKVQFAICILQTVVVVPIRGGDNAWDAIVGTFGGNPFHGGNSGGMAIFLVFGFSFVLALKRFHLLSRKNFMLLSACCLVPILLAEVKVVTILLPVAIFTVYGRSIVINPLKGALIIISSVILAASVLFSYQAMHYSESHDRTFSETVEYAFSEVTNDDAFYNVETGELGRVTAIRLWNSYTSNESIEKKLFGYGIANSRSKSSAYTSTLTNQFIFNIDRSSLVVMLWEIGLIGVILFVVMCLVITITGFSLSNKTSIPVQHRAYLISSSAGLMIILATFAYSKSFIDTPMTQVLFMWCAGYILFWANNSREQNIR